MKLTKSQLNYLRAVYELSADIDHKRGVRISDLAEKLDFSKASVSLAMTKLEQMGLICKDMDRRVSLTEQGELEAVSVMDKEDIIQFFLQDVLKLPEDLASKEAAKIDEALSMETICAMCRMSGHAVLKGKCSITPECKDRDERGE